MSERKVKTNNKRASAAWCEPIGELRGACAAVLEYVFVLHWRLRVWNRAWLAETRQGDVAETCSCRCFLLLRRFGRLSAGNKFW